MQEATIAAVRPRPEVPPRCPVSLRWRMPKAYWVTVVVLASYLWLRFKTRFRSRRVAQIKLEQLNRRNARRIYRAILELQGLYIKVGQLISIMTNFLPEAFRQELEGLQDQVPPRRFESIERRLCEEFDGKSPAELFESFEQQPIASASIGQVHLARLPGGQRVAVKVQYPDIERIVRKDLRALRRIISLVQRFIPYQGLDDVYREIRAIILQELDFNAEARNIETIAGNFDGSAEVLFPTVVWEFTTRRVLTTGYLEGIKVNDLRGIDGMGVDRSELARLVIEAYCQQIFHHGSYHADPHPGNILVSHGPTIKFVDFGAVAEISDAMRHGILNLLQGALNRDTNKIVVALREMGFIAHRSDPKIFDRVVDYFHTRFQDEVKLESFNLKDIKLDPARGLENLADLRQMNISLRDLTSTFHVPKEWIMLERTILLLMGLCTELDPDLNPMDVIRPHIEEFVLGKDRDWSKFLMDTARDVGLSALSMPQEIRKFTTRALQGDLELTLRGTERSARLHYALGQQLVFTALAISSFAFSLALENQRASFWLMVVSGLFGLLLLRSIWGTGRWLKDQD
jgi:predicted unusual protein kinase regulating ubiquinone biosynthesis (AarF/ABC1/UbiB family)